MVVWVGCLVREAPHQVSLGEEGAAHLNPCSGEDWPLV